MIRGARRTGRSRSGYAPFRCGEARRYACPMPLARTTLLRRLGPALALTTVTLLACKSPMAKIEKVRDALAEGDAQAITSATEDLPQCTEMPVRPDAGCLAALATALGSKTGFRVNPADQA